MSILLLLKRTVPVFTVVSSRIRENAAPACSQASVQAESPKSLYDTELASFAMDGYDVTAARGFIDLFGLPMQVRGLKHKPKL